MGDVVREVCGLVPAVGDAKGRRLLDLCFRSGGGAVVVGVVGCDDKACLCWLGPRFRLPPLGSAVSIFPLMVLESVVLLLAIAAAT